MAGFNVVIGVITGIIVVLPVFFIQGKSWRIFIAFTAVIATFVSMNISNHMLYPYYLSWQFEHEIKQEPLFSLIAEYHPVEYEQFIENAKQHLRKKEDIEKIALDSTQLVNRFFYQHLQNAPNENIIRYLQATLDLYHHLNGVDPRAVVKIENGDASNSFNFNDLWQDKEFKILLGHLLDSKRYAIEAAIKTPLTPPTKEEAKPLLQMVGAALANKYSEEAVRSAFAPQSNISANIASQIIIEYYAEILKSGKENAGVIIRHIANLRNKA